jgi:hypothetical protein
MLKKNNSNFFYSITFTLIFFCLSVVNSMLAQIPQTFGNFPITYFSNVGRPGFAEGLPIIADFKGDGSRLIVVGVHDKDLHQSWMYMIDINGNVLLGWPKKFLVNPLQAKEIMATAAGDINKDGKIELVVKTVDSLYVLDYKADNIIGFPKYFPDSPGNKTILSMSLYDLEQNGSLNIILAASHNIIVYDANGNIKSGWPRNIGNNACFGSGITVGDLDGDQKAEIITSSYVFGSGGVAIDSNYMHVFDRNGNYFSGWPVHSDSCYTFANSSIILKRDNSNPINSSIFAISFIPDTNISAPDKNRITVYGTSGNIKKRWYHNENMEIHNPLVADLNRDGLDELFTGNQNYQVFLYSMDGTLLPGWPKLGYNGYWWQSTIGKVKYGTQLYCISNSDVIDSNGFNAYDYNGNQPSGWPIKYGGIEYGMTFSDINLDNSVELIFTSWIPILSTQKVVLYIYTIPGIPYTNADFPWPMFAHDRYRTNQLGFVPPDEPIGIKPISNNVPGQFILYQNYPNPFNPVTTIKFDIPKQSEVKIVVFDILGREVSTLVNEQLKPGTYEVVWSAPSGDASNFSSGVYYYQLRAGNYIDTKKLVLVK